MVVPFYARRYGVRARERGEAGNDVAGSGTRAINKKYTFTWPTLLIAFSGSRFTLRICSYLYGIVPSCAVSEFRKRLAVSPSARAWHQNIICLSSPKRNHHHRQPLPMAAGLHQFAYYTF